MIKRILRRFGTLVLTMVVVLAFMPYTNLAVYAEDNPKYPLQGGAIEVECYENKEYAAWTYDEMAGTFGGYVKDPNDDCNGANTTWIRIYNKTEEATTISFSYSIIKKTDGDGVKMSNLSSEVSHVELNGSGSSYSGTVEAGRYIDILLYAQDGGGDTEIQISNIGLAGAKVNVAFHSATNGSYSVNDEQVSETAKREVSKFSIQKLKAEPNENSTFLGWYKKDGTLISKESEYDLKVMDNMEICAIFKPNDAGYNFRVMDKFFDSLKDAVAEATEGDCGIVVMEKDYVFNQDYTIPEGITLQIPFDNGETLCIEKPNLTREDMVPAVYRTLTVNEGVTLSISGSINVGGSYYAAQGGESGKCSGNYALIDMKKGSKIAVKDGGKLYAWGFVSGEGTVSAESGSSVYEVFQIGDFRGGTDTDNMSKTMVFPFSQYYVQNIEVPLTLQHGSCEIVGSGVYSPTLKSVFSTSIKFIGNDGMFKIASGSLTKEYDETTDRVIYSVDGESEINSMSLDLGGFAVNSKTYVLPITNNMTLGLEEESELTVNQDVALLPGAQVNIKKDADLTIAEGTKAYVYDADDWNGKNYVHSKSNYKTVVYTNVNKNQGVRTSETLVDAAICVNGTLTAEGDIYTTAGGANIYSTESGKYIPKKTISEYTEKYTYQWDGTYETIDGAKVVKLCGISVTPAKLRNADETYTDSPELAETLMFAGTKWKHTGAVPEGTTTYEWSEDNSKCVATRTCKKETDHTDVKIVNSTNTTTATCTNNGQTTYTAEFTENEFETQTKVVDANALGHSYKGGTCERCGVARPVAPAASKNEGKIFNEKENKTDGKQASTIAIVESKVTEEKAAVTIDVSTSKQIVEKAVENKSAEVVLEIQTDRTVKTAEVTVPTQAITEIIEKTEADLVIKIGETQITLDKTGIEELAEKAGTTEAVKIEVNTVESKESICQVNIEFVTSSGEKVDVKRGKVSVTVTPSAELFNKSIVCVYIDDNGIYHRVKGKKNADNTYTFIADKF